TDDEAALDLSRGHQLHHLGGCSAFAGNLTLRNAPHLCHLLALFQNIDVAVAGKLTRLLADLAATLSVALPGDHHGAAAELAQLTARQRKIDACEAVVDPVRAVLDAASVHHDGARSTAEHLRRHDDSTRRYTGDPLGKLRRVWVDDGLHLVPVARTVCDVLFVGETFRDDVPQHRVEDCDICTRTKRQPQVS